MNFKSILYLLPFILLYPSLGFTKEIVVCSFRDQQNVYREFMLNKTETDIELFFNAEKVEGQQWNIMGDDKNKLILFKETERSNSGQVVSAYTVFFIDKKSGNFTFRNYMQTEYVNTVRGDCRFD